MIVEIIAIGLTIWLMWHHGRDTYQRIFYPVKFTRGRYRQALRRMCERRYRRSANVRQQVRALECLAWDMRAYQSGGNRDVPRPHQVPMMMYSIPVLRIAHYEPPTMTRSEWEATRPPNAGIAWLASKPASFLSEHESP